MTIQLIGIIGYRTHSATALKLSPGLNILAGKRGRGKTSVSLAISTAFCFQNFLTGANGSGIDDQISTGCEEFGLVIKYTDASGKARKLERNLLVTNSERKHTLSLSGYEGAERINDKQIEVLRSLGVRREIALACFDVRTLRERTIEEQRAEVLAVIQKSGEQIAIEPKIAALLKTHLKVDCIETLGDITALYERAADKRKSKKAEQARLLPGEPPERPNKTEKEYREDQTAWSQQAAVHARRVGEITSQLESYARAKAKSDAPKAQEPEPLAPMETATRNALDKSATEKAEYTAAVSEYRRLKEIKSAVDATASTGKKTCDTCGTTLTAKKLREYSDRLGRDIAALVVKGKELADVHLEALDEYEKARDTEAALRTQWSNYLGEVGSRVAPPEPIDESALCAEKAAEEEAQAKATRNVSKAMEFGQLARAAEAHDAKAKAFDAGRLELEELEWLCEVLGKNGIRKDLFSQWAAPFLAAMNEVTGVFRIKCSLDVDAGIMANGRLPMALSQGDLLIFEVAYRRAIAIHSGLKMMFLDASERLPEQERDELWKLLRKIGSEGMQIIATEATDVLRPGVFWFEWTAEGGTVVSEPSV